MEKEEQELFKPTTKGFFALLGESFKFFTLNLPAIATIVIPVFFVVQFLVPLIEHVIPDFANGLTGYDFLDDFFNFLIKLIIVALISQIIGAIAWIAVIRVIAGAMHGEKLPPIQAMQDGTKMLPMYAATAVIYYLAIIISSFLLVIPAFIVGVYFAFWQFSYILRGNGAISAFKHSASLVHGNFIRVSLNLVGLWVFMYILNNFVIGIVSGYLAVTIDPDEGMLFSVINAIFMGLGKVFQGIQIIFMMSLFMALEDEQ